MALKEIGITQYIALVKIAPRTLAVSEWPQRQVALLKGGQLTSFIEFSLTSILAFQAKLRLEMAAEHGKHMVQKELESKEDELEQYRFNMQKKVQAISTRDDQLIFAFVVIVSAEFHFQRADRSQHHD